MTEDSVINKLLEGKAMPESVYDYVDGKPQYNESRARAYARSLIGGDAAASRRAGEDPNRETTAPQMSDVASEVKIKPGDTHWFSPDEPNTPYMDRTALPDPAAQANNADFNPQKEALQPNDRRTK